MTKNNARQAKARQDSLLSPIRTLTVGPGITPGLLSFRIAPEALAGFQRQLIYRRWGISPRPENKQKHHNAEKVAEQRTKTSNRLSADD